MSEDILQKLRYPSTGNALIVNPHGAIEKMLTKGMSDLEPTGDSYDFILAFVQFRSEVENLAAAVRPLLTESSLLWLAYPKKASGIASDLTRDTGWSAFTDQGLRGIAIVSLDANWSAIRFRSQNQNEKYSTVTDEAVEKATGRTWMSWFVLLNAANGKNLSHKQLVKLLSEKHEISGWWSQMITNTYEKYISRRKKHEQQTGFEVSVSKTLGFSVDKLYNAFTDDRDWMSDAGYKISTARNNSSVRALWTDGKTRISIGFYRKSETRTQVTIQHSKIQFEEEVEEKREYWKRELEKLVNHLQ